MTVLPGCYLRVGIWACFIPVSLAGEYCTTSRYLSRTTYCSNDCCGTYPYEYCCTDIPVNVGVYVGGAFGAIVVFCVLVAIVCVFIKKGQRGRVMVRPAVQPGNNISVVSANTSNQYSGNTYSQPMGAQQMQPTPYGQAVPPPYSYSNPAYPPTQHAAPGPSDPYATAAFSTKS
ncbi:uncharacterized protein [Littorina saxatilis]|uniref:uncharacterized protein isoform X3 n=1 Tax=Littorina saxatilis TaxID=31220 RepID=UPI0038B51EC8